MPRLKVLMMLSLATTLCAPAFGQNAISARPGTLNYIEGQGSIDGQALTSKSVGHAELHPGETIETGNGKAEVLLTPGVFLRLGDNSSVKMVSPSLTHTEVQVDRGRAEVEVDQIYKQNNLLVDQGQTQTQLLKGGLYEFSAADGNLRVFDGKAAVLPTADGQKPVVVKGGHELALNGTTKPVGFDRNDAKAQDSLYSWSSLRSEYLGEANERLAPTYVGASGFYPGWFWDPGLYAYTWLPGGGPFFSPFGAGFYSPYYLGGGGLIYGRGGYGYGYRGGIGYRGGVGFHGPVGIRGGFAGRSAGGFSGGGFHGGGGGFHGGAHR